MSSNFHERLDQPELPLPSDRSTGVVFAAVSAVVAFFWRADQSILYIAGGLAVAFLALSLLAPTLLRPLNIAWMKFGLALNRIMNPIIMLVLFAVAIVPAGLLMQLRADPLRKRRQPESKSYWMERQSDGKSSMSNQF